MCLLRLKRTEKLRIIPNVGRKSKMVKTAPMNNNNNLQIKKEMLIF